VTEKVYAVLGATVSLKVGLTGSDFRGNPKDLKQEQLELLPDATLSVATKEGDATASVENGLVVFPKEGVWVISAELPQGRPFAGPASQEVVVGEFKANKVNFIANQHDPNSAVLSIVPSLLGPVFPNGKGVATTAVPAPTSTLASITLGSQDFDWKVVDENSPVQFNNAQSSFIANDSRPIEVNIEGILKIDPTKKVTGALASGVSLSVKTPEVTINQKENLRLLTNIQKSWEFTGKKFEVVLTAGKSKISTLNSDYSAMLQDNEIIWDILTGVNLAKIEDGFLIPDETKDPGKVELQVSLVKDSSIKATASVNVTNDGGLVINVN
jgi:hypothetical protein